MQKGMYLRSSDFKGHEIKAFPNDYEAIAYLEDLSAEGLPDICVIDALSGEFPFVDTDSGFRSALIFEALFRAKNHTNVTFLFKSADDRHSKQAVQNFRAACPDSRSGTVSAPRSFGAIQLYQIDPDGYTPPLIPNAAKEFLTQAARTHPIHMYDTFHDRLETLHAHWNSLDHVSGTEDVPAIAFSYGGGRVKQGLAIVDLSALANIAKDEKAILFCDDIPHDVLHHAHRLSGIVMIGDSDIPGHLRLLLQPYDVSILIGSENKGSIRQDRVNFDVEEGFGIDSYQPLTIDPGRLRLYPKKLDIVSMDALMPRARDYIEEMKIFADNFLSRTSVVVPEFTANVSSEQDRQSKPDEWYVGLTRTEHFIGPYAAPQKWLVTKDFLIGEGARLRSIFDRAGQKYQDLPFIKNKRDAYERAYRFVAPLPACVAGYSRDDVVRLLDIPPDEFLSGDDLLQFEKLYGENCRGVQLAKKVPELYIHQLRMFMGFGKFHESGLPTILIPGVKDAEDIDFVKECVKKALPPRFHYDTQYGAMIETVQACHNIEDIAKKVSFISIGTNDLTAEIHQASRGSVGDAYLFQSLSPDVLEMIGNVVREARKANPRIHLAVCGEAATDPQSLMELRDKGIWIDSFSVPTTFKDTQLLPLVYKNAAIQDFCGPLKEQDEYFFMGPRMGV